MWNPNSLPLLGQLVDAINEVLEVPVQLLQAKAGTLAY